MLTSNSVLLLGGIVLILMLIYINQLKCPDVPPPTQTTIKEGYTGGVEQKGEESYYGGELIPNYEFAADAAASNPQLAADMEPEYAGTVGNVFNSMPAVGAY